MYAFGDQPEEGIYDEEAWERGKKRRIFANAAKTRRKKFVEANPRGQEIIDFINDNAYGSDFFMSLKTAVNDWGSLSDKQVAAVIKIIDERAAQRAAFEAKRGLSKPRGVVGSKVRIEGTVVGRFSYETQWGIVSGRIIEDGNDVIVWKGSGRMGYLHTGDVVQFDATVKAHEEYDGQDRTIVSRPTGVRVNGMTFAEIEQDWDAFTATRLSNQTSK